MTHETIESLSAYLDDEIDAPVRSAIEAHLRDCSECRGRVEALRRASTALSQLPEITPTPDESRALRLGVREALPSGRRWLRAPAGLALAGGLGLVLAGFVAFAVFFGGGQKTSLDRSAEEAAPAVGSLASQDLSSDTELAEAVRSDPEVAEKRRAYTVADVGASQERALREFASAGDPGDRLGAAESAPGGERSLAFCLEAILRTQRRPTMPASAAAVTYQGEPAYLLVYVYTDSNADDAPLDKVEVWVVDRVGCERGEAWRKVLSDFVP
jgi:predicted anti-sigma-YlaC factor YlaD